MPRHRITVTPAALEALAARLRSEASVVSGVTASAFDASTGSSEVDMPVHAYVRAWTAQVRLLGALTSQLGSDVSAASSRYVTNDRATMGAPR